LNLEVKVFPEKKGKKIYLKVSKCLPHLPRVENVCVRPSMNHIHLHE
jgi:hypothetical protein